MKDYNAFIAHLKRTGRIKLLPMVLRELRAKAAREEKLAPHKETAKEHPALISGWRQIADGRLTDRSGKGALVEMYRQVAGSR